MPKVYICCPVHGMNLLPAQAFSEETPLFLYEGPPLTFNSRKVIEEIQQKVAGATAGDYLVLCGDPSIMALCAIEMYEETGGNFRILKWDKKNSEYYPITLDYPPDYSPTIEEEEHNE